MLKITPKNGTKWYEILYCNWSKNFEIEGEERSRSNPLCHLCLEFWITPLSPTHFLKVTCFPLQMILGGLFFMSQLPNRLFLTYLSISPCSSIVIKVCLYIPTFNKDFSEREYHSANLILIHVVRNLFDINGMTLEEFQGNWPVSRFS